MPDSNLADTSVLTSTFYNTYIREQVVVTCTSGARPTGVDGRLIYETDTNRIMVYNGTSWVQVAGNDAWASYTPTLTNGTVGNGTLDFKYLVNGSTVDVRGQFTLGSTSTITGSFGFSFPSGFNSTTPIAVGVSVLRDATSTDSVGTCITSGYIQVWSAAAVPVNTTVPFTWTTSDIINIAIRYEWA